MANLSQYTHNGSFRCPRLKPKNTEKVLQEYGNRARKLEGQKLDLDDFAQFLDVPVSDMLRDMFALFDEVNSTDVFLCFVLFHYKQMLPLLSFIDSYCVRWTVISHCCFF